MAESGWFNSCASAAPICPNSLSRATCVNSAWSCSMRRSALSRSVKSRTKPVNIRRPSSFDSPTESSIGNNPPSLRCPVTSRPIPMMRRSPVSEIAADITVMLFAIGLRHQRFHILADDFGGGIAEHLLGRWAEGFDQSALADDDHGIGHSIENASESRLALLPDSFRLVIGAHVLDDRDPVGCRASSSTMTSPAPAPARRSCGYSASRWRSLGFRRPSVGRIGGDPRARLRDE